MKVEYVLHKPEFMPIQIILETEDEFRSLLEVVSFQGTYGLDDFTSDLAEKLEKMKRGK